MNVRELVGGEIFSAGPKQSMGEAAGVMSAAGVGALAVLREHRLVGIVTERDLVNACAEGVDVGEALVEEWMTKGPDSLDPDMDARDAAEWMLAAGYRHLPVADGENLIGMLSIKDVLWALTDPSVV